jgi:excisionase family DNA binding protein
MNTALLVTGDELTEIIRTAVAPLKQEIAELKTQITGGKKLLSVQEVAKLTDVHHQTVREWIDPGVAVERRGRKSYIRLKKVDGLARQKISIRPADLDEFLSQFPSVA